MRSTFGVHNPFLLRHIFQLRVGLSHLRHHKNRHNFADTPSNICLCNNGVEDTRHFLLFCPFYISQRVILTNCVNEILRMNNLTFTGNFADLYLYGHPSLNHSENRKILIASVEYIKNTNRFKSH